MDNSMQISTNVIDVHLNKERITNMLTIADQFHKAGCFTKDVSNVFQAFTKIQAGVEMGMAPMEAMNSLYIVNGNVTMWGKALTTRLRKFGWAIKYDDSKQDECTATISKGEETYSYTSTQAELKALNSRAAGFALKDKLKWHAISRICRFYVPEVLGSISYVAEEMDSDSNFGKSSSNSVSNIEGSKLEALATAQAEKEKQEIKEVEKIATEPANTIESEVVEVKLGELKKKEAPVNSPSTGFYDDEVPMPTEKIFESAQEVFSSPETTTATATAEKVTISARQKKEIDLMNALEKNPSYPVDRMYNAFNAMGSQGEPLTEKLSDSQLDICIQAVKKNKSF